MRITAAKDQDIFRSEAARATLLQSAKPVSSMEASVQRPVQARFGFNCFWGFFTLNFYAGTVTRKARGVIGVSDVVHRGRMCLISYMME